MRTRSRLAIVQGTTHYDLLSSGIVAELVQPFLDAPAPKYFGSDPARVARGVMATYAAWYGHSPEDAPKITRALYRLAVGGALSEEHVGIEPYFLDDLFEVDAHVPPEQAHAELRSFLARFSEAPAV